MILAWLHIVFHNSNVLSSIYWESFNPIFMRNSWVSQIASSWVHIGLHRSFFLILLEQSVSQKFSTRPASWFTWALIKTYIVVATFLWPIYPRNHINKIYNDTRPGFQIELSSSISLSIIVSSHSIGFSQEASNSLCQSHLYS